MIGGETVGQRPAKRPAVPTSPRQLLAVTALAGGALTLAVLVVPFLRFAYGAPALHIVLETLNAFIALVVAYLVYGRYRDSHRAQDLLLVLGLGAVAVANLVLTAVPLAAFGQSGDEINRWAALGVRFLGTVFLLWAAITPRPATVRPRPAAALVTVVLVALTAAAVIGLSLGTNLPAAVAPQIDVSKASHPDLAAHPVVVAAHAAGVLIYAAAAVAFARDAEKHRDELLRWVAGGCVLASFAWLHYLLFPSLYSDYVYTGDVLRFGFYALMFIGAAREIRSYWDLRSRAAVLEDRRRMARDLHDGLAQELAYITAQSQRLTVRPEDELALNRVRAAANRALDEARQAIAALTHTPDEPFETLLQRSLDALAGRYDVQITTMVDADTQLTLERREALLRISAEAVRNAVQHGGATRIDITLTDDPLRLSVTDDGSGFDVEAPVSSRAGGFGLTSMRERAAAVGGQLSIKSSSGDGTTVEVELP
jgi:signal transduction histidine kinase